MVRCQGSRVSAVDGTGVADVVEALSGSARGGNHASDGEFVVGQGQVLSCNTKSLVNRGRNDGVRAVFVLARGLAPGFAVRY